MTKRYLGNIITQNPTAPAGNLQNSAAKGVWSLEEQLAYQKAGLWPVPGNAVDITDVFSTYLYEGTATNVSHQIQNGIDLAGEGGLVWIKKRDSNVANANHYLSDTERGNFHLASNSTNPQGAGDIASYNSDGWTFNASTGLGTDYLGSSYASWTFRKAPKFFTCLTYTGTGSAQNISHDLGSVPGMVICKRTDDTSDWGVYHRQLNGGTDRGHWRIKLNSTGAQVDQDTFWNDTAPSDSVFTVGTSTSVNASGGTYVAYLFAHNDGDGEFGPDGSDIIKCGSYTATGSDVDVDLGWEPQFIITRNVSRATEWNLQDTMRGMTDNSWTRVIPNDNTADFSVTSAFIFPTSTGFKVTSVGNEFGNAGDTVIYMAIRRGPLASPTAGTEVFAMDTLGATTPNPPSYNAGFPVDLGIMKSKTSGTDFWRVGARLTGEKRLRTDNTDAEATDTQHKFDYQDGWYDAGSYVDSQYQSWMWKRAPGYFDVVAYTGNRTGGASQVIPHNLTVLPEMIWVKNRTEGQPWQVYTATTGNTKAMYLDTTNGATTDNSWGNTSPTATNFTVGDDSGTNNTDNNFIAYLFASLPGISKVGSYTADGNAQNIDCGFTSGARFVLIKRTDTSGNWFVLDTLRGIVSGNDPLLELNSTGAEDNQYDNLDPYSAGFTVAAYGGTSPYLNISGGTYIFYAIA